MIIQTNRPIVLGLSRTDQPTVPVDLKRGMETNTATDMKSAAMPSEADTRQRKKLVSLAKTNQSSTSRQTESQ